MKSQWGYEVGIPWISDHIDLENNKSLALQRLESLERSLRPQQDVAERYNKVLESYEKKGYIKKLTDEDAFKRRKSFLPHFPVVREDRATTKVRIVFGSAAKFKERHLHDMMHSGPKLQQDLVNILICIRRYPVALVGDISEMFLQVELANEDRPYHCILWQNMETNRRPDIFEFQQLIFDEKCSPYLAKDVCRHPAES